MAFPLIGALGGVLGLGAGLIGGISASNAQQKALFQAEKAAQQYMDAVIPDPKEQQLLLQRYQQTGQLDPKLQQVVKQTQSHLSNVQTDPGLKAAQLKALRSLSDISDRGGRTLDQDAYLNKVQNEVAADNRGKIDAIRSNFASRGMGQPGGLEMAAQVANAQNETQRAGNASLEAARQAQVNALRSIAEGGDLATKVRGQDFDQQAQIAKAQDDIERFNTAAINSVNANNTAAQNRARELNWRNTQDIANKNVDIANAEQEHNKALIQQNFDNKMKKASGQANALNQVANQYNDIGKTNAGMWSGIGQGAITAGAAGQMWSDRNNKNNDEDEEE